MIHCCEGTTWDIDLRCFTFLTITNAAAASAATPTTDATVATAMTVMEGEAEPPLLAAAGVDPDGPAPEPGLRVSEPVVVVAVEEPTVEPGSPPLMPTLEEEEEAEEV